MKLIEILVNIFRWQATTPVICVKLKYGDSKRTKMLKAYTYRTTRIKMGFPTKVRTTLHEI